jgi:hypothetical protein
MGCDIHWIVEKRTATGWERLEIDSLGGRCYALFGWLADVRNYSAIPPISRPRGLPRDYLDSAGFFKDHYHSVSWLGVKELQEFDYDQAVEDRRVSGRDALGMINGGLTAPPGCGRMTTYRELFPEEFFEALEGMRRQKADRVIFGFDS